MSIEHYVDGQRVYTLAQASDLLHVAEATLRKRVQYYGVQAAGWINPRLPVYHLDDLARPKVSEPNERSQPRTRTDSEETR